MTSLLLDVSTHGVVEANGPKARSGIFRFVDGFVRNLVVHEDLDLHLCATRRPVHALRFWAKDSVLSRRSFKTSFCQSLAARHPRAEQLAALERRLAPAALSPAQSSDTVFWAGHYHFLAARPKRFRERIVTIHDILPLQHPEWFPQQEKALLRQALQRIRDEDWFVVFDTHHVQKLAEQIAGLSPSRSTYIHPGIELSHFRPPHSSEEIAAALNIVGLDASPYFLTLCTLEPRKGLGTAVRAFCKAMTSGFLDPATRLVLVGPHGWGTTDLEHALSEAGEWRSRIVLAGFVPDAYLPALYAGAEAFLFPSLAEGFGFPPLEAMASGCPVIASKASCMPEVLGTVALYAPPEDDSAWTLALEHLHTDGERTARIEAGIRHASKYSWDSYVQHFLERFAICAGKKDDTFSQHAS